MRRGVNVLAIEVVRAPYDKVVDQQKTISWDKEPMHNIAWNTCEMEAICLTADGKGVEPNAARPAGLQVWNSSLLRTDFALDRGDPCEPLRPMVIAAARNGTFSEKVVVGSIKPIRGLKAAIGDLKGAEDVLLASAVQVRYAVAGGGEYGIYNYTYGIGTSAVRDLPRAEALGVLLESAPEECNVAKVSAPARAGASAAGDTRSLGAVMPIWLTVKVPAIAKPGGYEGKLVISCEGESPVAVPVRVDVADWTLPDPDKYRTWMELIQSPDTLALEYGVPLWSDRHFELIARSFRLMREVGSGVLYLPLICCTHYGNEETIVRWVKKGENQYDFDFTAMDKYLDVAEKNLGHPKLVCFIVWDIFLLPIGDTSGHGSRVRDIDRVKDRMTCPYVTTLDPATRTLDRASFPGYPADAACKQQWQKLFGELRARMKKRGLEDAMMLGWFSDTRARKEELDFWREVAGDLPWVSHGHFKTTQFGNSEKLGFKTGYMTSIHDVDFPEDPAKVRKYGWKNPVLHAQQYIRIGWRGEMEMLPGTMWHSLTEINIAGSQRGFGRLGADSWAAIKDKNGQRVGRAYERYPWSIWGNLELRSLVLAPGSDGAVATNRFEALREGVQECEARIYLESALCDEAGAGSWATTWPCAARPPWTSASSCAAGGVAVRDVPSLLQRSLDVQVPNRGGRARVVPEHRLARAQRDTLRSGRRGGEEAAMKRGTGLHNRSQLGWGLVHFSAGNRVWREKRGPKIWTCPLSRRGGT